MFPNPWGSTVPPPAVTKPMVNNYENNAQTYPFYATPSTLQSIPVSQPFQPNAIDPAMVQKWQEWKQWELWQQQFQQWQQQQTGQIAAAATQPAPPPMPPSQPLQPSQPPIPFQNLQYQYNQPGPPLPPANQPQINTMRSDVGTKRGLESDVQDSEKKIKIETITIKKETELNDETEALFEEQFKSWEEQFFKWKEQNKNHPDKAQYIEYEKKWLNWRDHLKQKCEVLKRKRELKMAEKKKEALLAEENKLHSLQKSSYNPMIPNVTPLAHETPTIFQHLHNNSSIAQIPDNQIPGLDIGSNSENGTKGFLNVSRIIPQNHNGPIQTPDDKPFNFPKSITNSSTVNQFPVSVSHGNVNKPSATLYQNSPNWSKYNNPVAYYNQKPPDVDNNSISMYSQQTDTSSRLPYGEDTSNTTYNSLQNPPNMNYRKPLEGSYNNASNETNTMYNKPLDDQSYNRNFNTSNNFHSYNQPNANTSNFNRSPEKSNIPYQQQKPSLNTTSSRPPSLLSLNVIKPHILDKPGNYSDSKNVAPNRYERNWNIADEEDDPENEYMEAHKKFSSEPYDDENNEDQFSNKQHRNAYNESNYTTRDQQGFKNFNDDYSRPINQARGFKVSRNVDNDYHRPNSQFPWNVNQNYPREVQTLKNKEDDYYKSQNNVRSVDQGFSRALPVAVDLDKEYSKEPAINKNNYVSQKGNYGQPSRGNYEPSRGNFGSSINKTNMDWDDNYIKKEGFKQPDIIPPEVQVKPYEEALPIDPVKIFDYRHLPPLKVIPGLSKETVIPIKIYEYKHGGKRILPWQDRGFSRRNLNNTRDLNEKEIANIDNTNELNENKKSIVSLNDTLSEEKQNEEETKCIKENIIEINNDTSATMDSMKIVNDDGNDIKKEPLPSEVENIDRCDPYPPRAPKIMKVEKPSNRQLLNIETLLNPPGRFNRPSKIVLILRGLPGSGKSYVAKLIKEKEVAMGGQAPRILSLDDYFMTEVTKTEIDPETNKSVERKVLEYEHDSANENLYRTSLIKAFKKKLLENFFSFYIIDAINNKVTYYKDIIEIAKCNGYTVYIIELEVDIDLCIKRNIHNRTAQDVNNIMRSWVKTPDDQILLDIRPLLQTSLECKVEMEDVSDIEMELDKEEESVSEENKNIDFEEEDVMKLLSCKWTDTIPQEEKMKRLDGLCKKKTENSIKEWLQIPEESYSFSEQNEPVKDGKKRVRWADMEERREQEKMRAIGFVVGQTDWDRMLGRDQGESKLTQTKYI